MTEENAMAFITSDDTITHVPNFNKDSDIEIVEDFKDVVTREKV